MEQSGIVYELEGPDGTTVVLDGTGDEDTAFRIHDVDGLDSAEQRGSIHSIPEEDGVDFGDFYLGQRSIVFDGTIRTEDVPDRNQAIVNLARASMALRGDAELRFQPDGMPALFVRVRREQRLRVAGKVVKEFQLALVAKDPRLYTQALATAEADAVVALGAAFPWVFPVNFGGGSGAFAAVTIDNVGNYKTPAQFTIHGHVADPRLVLASTGETLYLDGITVQTGETVVVDMAARTVVRSDGTSLYSHVRRPGSTWWEVPPGSQTVQLLGLGSGTGVSLDAAWRSAWA